MKVTKQQLAIALIGCSVAIAAVLSWNYSKVADKVEKKATSIESKIEVKELKREVKEEEEGDMKRR